MYAIDKLWFLIIALCWVNGALGIFCFNCSSTHRKDFGCAGDFSPLDAAPFNNSRILLVNCSGDDSMCFVRSWAARARYAWMVQRGCYRVNKEDNLPKSMKIPTRSMTCRYERYPDAEYKLCFCKADWCNSASNYRGNNNYITYCFIGILIYYTNYV